MNITFDFTGTDQLFAGEEVAVMPASLAQKLLRSYTSHLRSASSEEIIGTFIDDLRSSINNDNPIESAVLTAREFVRTRELVRNIATDNWDAYKVDQGPKVVGYVDIDQLDKKRD